MILQLVSSKYFFLQIHKNIQFKNTIYTQFKGYFLSLSLFTNSHYFESHTFFEGKKLRSPQKKLEAESWRRHETIVSPPKLQ